MLTPVRLGDNSLLQLLQCITSRGYTYNIISSFLLLNIKQSHCGNPVAAFDARALRLKRSEGKEGRFEGKCKIKACKKVRKRPDGGFSILVKIANFKQRKNWGHIVSPTVDF
jgi:hypothetical protein